MRFAKGGTRFVLLAGGLAIKFARPRPIRWIKALHCRLHEGTVRERLKFLHDNPVMAVIRYLFPGPFANRTESRFSQRYSNPQIEPIIFSFLWMINVQRRGEPVMERDLLACPFQDLTGYARYPDMAFLKRAEQFARFGDEIRLIDYGNWRNAEALMAHPMTKLRRSLSVAIAA